MWRWYAKRIHFGTTFNLFEKYLDFLRSSRVKLFDFNLSIEILKILDQMDYALECVKHLDKKIKEFGEVEREFSEEPYRPAQIDLDEQDAFFRMQFYTESFYLTASRIIKIAKGRKGLHPPLPGLETFKPTG